MSRTLPRAIRHVGPLLGLLILALLLASPLRVNAQGKGAPSASFDPATGILKINGDDLDNIMAIARDAAGAILVNGGAVAITGGPANVATIKLIELRGLRGDDQLALSIDQGSLPAVQFWGGDGDDSASISGGAAAESFSASGDGKRVRVARNSPDPSLLDLIDTESLLLQAGDGDDSFALGPDLTPLSTISVDGGAGKDSIAVSGGDAAEVFTVTASGGRVRFDRTYPNPFTLDIGTVEALQLSTNGGADRYALGEGVEQLLALTVDQQTVTAASPDAVMGLTATFAAGILTVIGDDLANTINVGRDAAGRLLINGGSVAVAGGTPTVANTSLIQLFGKGGKDALALNESNGALPAARMYGGTENDAMIGGSGADQLYGQAGDDVLAGKGGADLLFGGTENDTLTGGSGDDQVFGERNNDRMIWNPGDGTDLLEGADGTDAVEVNGGNGGENFTVTANGTRVRFDRLDPAPFSLDIGSSEKLLLNMNGGDDTFSASGNLAALIALTVDGGANNDTISGSNGADVLRGGDGTDFVAGKQGNDAVALGAGADTFQWDPGDGNDVVDGGADSDTLNFDGANSNENIDIAANGARVRFTRNVGNIVMGLDGFETINFNALGGTDNVVVNDLKGTGVTTLNLNLGFAGAGDGQADSVTVNGTGGIDNVNVSGAGSTVAVSGLATTVNINNPEIANDSLVINGLGGNDQISAALLPAGLIRLTVDGGANNDTILGSAGDDVLRGGDGNDSLFGRRGNDVLFMGNGNDSATWDPGDGSDTIEGQADSDTLNFNGANIGENIGISANGARVRFTRDVGIVTMDLNDVETINFKALGGADNIVVDDLSGTAVNLVNVDLRGSSGGDGQADAVGVNATQGPDVFGARGADGTVNVVGLKATVNIAGAEPANDRLTLNALGGADTVNATPLKASAIQLTINGGADVDLLLGGEGADLVNGGTGNDVARLGAGSDVFVWNPGDGSDVVEGGIDSDALIFNGANINERIELSTNGARVRFTRDVGIVSMDLNDVETITYNALGGADTVIVNDLSGTDVIAINVNLSAFGAGDGQADSVILNATNGDDVITVGGGPGGIAVAGLAAGVNISGSEVANDQLIINALAGDDVVDASGLNAGAIRLTEVGGPGNDVQIGSAGDDILQGNDGDDVLLGGPGLDVLDGGPGNNILLQD